MSEEKSVMTRYSAHNAMNVIIVRSSYLTLVEDRALDLPKS